MIPYTPPTYEAPAYNCPHCGAYAEQTWKEPDVFRSLMPLALKFAWCRQCEEYTIWHAGQLLYPEDTGVPQPNPDLREDIRQDYSEAASIVRRSPRGAAALLRLCIQKLCEQLGETGKHINSDISNLVKKGLPVKIQQALDIVRVVGNNAVHPGQMDLADDQDTAIALFMLVNAIADVMITQPKGIAQLYGSLPESAREAIEKRDEGGTP